MVPKWTTHSDTFVTHYKMNIHLRDRLKMTSGLWVWRHLWTTPSSDFQMNLYLSWVTLVKDLRKTRNVFLSQFFCTKLNFCFCVLHSQISREFFWRHHLSFSVVNFIVNKQLYKHALYFTVIFFAMVRRVVNVKIIDLSSTIFLQ